MKRVECDYFRNRSLHCRGSWDMCLPEFYTLYNIDLNVLYRLKRIKNTVGINQIVYNLED